MNSSFEISGSARDKAQPGNPWAARPELSVWNDRGALDWLLSRLYGLKRPRIPYRFSVTQYLKKITGVGSQTAQLGVVIAAIFTFYRVSGLHHLAAIGAVLQAHLSWRAG